ncbi:MarR family winged helix-turn-helix transcriptional regulator [Pyxidicoccus parkwayensis]|nr:MarR family transcriptional regulator [Pyxidicoccus parkwaysis]
MQLLALKSIAHGVRSQAALAERLGVDPPAASRLVDRLEEDGLVHRRAGEDRRCVRLELGEKGHAEMELVHAALQWVDGELRKHLEPAEVTELQRLLTKLQDGVSQEEDSSASGGCATDE